MSEYILSCTLRKKKNSWPRIFKCDFVQKLNGKNRLKNLKNDELIISVSSQFSSMRSEIFRLCFQSNVEFLKQKKNFVFVIMHYYSSIHSLLQEYINLVFCPPPYPHVKRIFCIKWEKLLRKLGIKIAKILISCLLFWRYVFCNFAILTIYHFWSKSLFVILDYFVSFFKY